MATFEVTVTKITQMEKHPNPEVNALELVVIGDYRAIVRIGQFKLGDLIVYIPEQALVPQSLLKLMGLENKLSGPGKNRVKAIKLKGQLSQGLVLDMETMSKFTGIQCVARKETDSFNLGFYEGQDVAYILGIEKWEPEIPSNLKGKVYGSNYRVKFDVENYKRWSRNDIFTPNEMVYFTEKIHGTCHIAALVPPEFRQEDMYEGKFFVSSKGLARDGFMQKVSEENKDNLYVQVFEKFNLKEKLEKLAFILGKQDVMMVGEAFGPVQDLKYGSSNEVKYRCFGICADGEWMDFVTLVFTCLELDIPMVPVLYHGPFSHEKVVEFTTGKETITGTESHIREGIVIYPETERIHPKLGRVFLKSVSEDYLLRKDGSEFN